VKNRLILALTLTIYCLLASAQDTANADKDRQYVTDQLRLSLYSNASSDSQVLRLLQSSDILIVDEISGSYALVTVADGTRGWVKRGFLVTSPTASILLSQEQVKNASLLDEIEKLANSKVIIDTYEKDMDEMLGKIEVLKTEKNEVNEAAATLQQKISDLQLKLDRKAENNEPIADVLLEIFLRYWKIIIPGFLGFLLLCFLISKVIIESRIKSRFHGIKIW
jgi:hypothetical protein